MFDRLATLAHGLRVLVKALLDGLQETLLQILETLAKGDAQ
jgi:hypothetical protein